MLLTVLLYSYIQGSENDILATNASFIAGHVDVVTRAYAREQDQVPNDLALVGVEALLADLRAAYPDIVWTPRIRFAGLLDVPDATGETRVQGPARGLAVALRDPESPERENLNLAQALVRGRLPAAPFEILVSEVFSRRLGVAPRDTVTFLGTTMYGSLSAVNLAIAGTLHFGVSAMDRGAVIADVEDLQYTLDMTDAAGEVLGFFRDGVFRAERARAIATTFNQRTEHSESEFAPFMRTLRDHHGLAETLDLARAVGRAVIGLFVVVMSIVLWNAGLMGSLRRYGEFGLRLAIGESHGHLFRSLLLESLLIGLVGSLLGTAVGLALSFYLQARGLDISPLLKNASMMISDVLRARVTPVSWVIGFIPGVVATLLGSAIAGFGIFRRQTSQLTKELLT